MYDFIDLINLLLLLPQFKKMSKVELLAPQNGIYGQEAINHGADAVMLSTSIHCTVANSSCGD